jgi:hypothetical protein
MLSRTRATEFRRHIDQLCAAAGYFLALSRNRKVFGFSLSSRPIGNRAEFKTEFFTGSRELARMLTYTGRSLRTFGCSR